MYYILKINTLMRFRYKKTADLNRIIILTQLKQTDGFIKKSPLPTSQRSSSGVLFHHIFSVVHSLIIHSEQLGFISAITGNFLRGGTFAQILQPSVLLISSHLVSDANIEFALRRQRRFVGGLPISATTQQQ